MNETLDFENAVKSNYILKCILSFLSEYKKLSLINYNKHIQHKLNIDIEDYKEVSRKYKIAEKNGEGKEYKLYSNKKIFEGEYLNRKRNGKGKEYYEKGELKFEGEYLNGKRWKGKGYDIDGKLKFEGEFYNERIWNGKGYNYFGKEEFEINDGKGYIKEYNNEGILIYEGRIFKWKKKWKRKRIFKF